jgi:aryl-alcohol dehydrogenase-like predicted oxidoreductase
MELRTIGKSGLRVSLVGLGCNNFGRRNDPEGTRLVVDKALDLGITLFDTADVYGGDLGSSEDFLGRALGSHRKDIVLATKGGMSRSPDNRLVGGSRRYMITAVEESLKRLGTDWIDLYQLHKPDPLTPIEETLRTFDDLIRQGKVRYVGCSNLPAWQVTEAQWISRQLGIERFISIQDEYSLLVRDPERELLPMAETYGVGLLPYFPLAGGMLTGKYRKDQPLPEGARLNVNGARYGDRFINERNWTIVTELQAFCEARGKSLLELAFSWLAANPNVSSIIAGATGPEQVEANVAAVSWTLTVEDLKEIDRITGQGRG